MAPALSPLSALPLLLVALGLSLLVAVSLIYGLAKGTQEGVEGFARPKHSYVWAIGLLIVIVLASMLSYLTLGLPQMIDWPLHAARTQALQQRLAGSQLDLDAAIQKIQAKLNANPKDGEAWSMLARAYLLNQDRAGAIMALRNLIEIEPQQAEAQAQLAELLIEAGQGKIDEEAASHLHEALRLDPELVSPQYFLAELSWQQGHQSEAIDAWHKLISQAPEGAPWLSAVKTRLAQALKDALALLGATDDEASKQKRQIWQTMLKQIP